MTDHGRGWMHFEEAPSHRDPAVGKRVLSIAVVEDGVVLVATKDGRPASCTISFEDYDLLAHLVDMERSTRGT